jgi:hypothetical protein
MGFDIRSISMDIQPGEGITRITVAPEDLYPAMIQRIQEVLSGANPNEILASTERGGNARADRLIAEAKALPADAWDDALKPRGDFIGLPYFSVVEKNGRLREELVTVLAPKTRPDVMRMVQRGYALEIAMGWFLHAARLEFGAIDTTIQPRSAEGKELFRL